MNKQTDKQKAKDLILKEVFSGEKHKEAVTKAAIESSEDQNKMLNSSAIKESIKALSMERENILRFMDRSTRTSSCYDTNIRNSLGVINEQINLLISKL